MTEKAAYSFRMKGCKQLFGVSGMRGGEGDSENPSDSGQVGRVAVMTIGGQIHTMQTSICRKLPGTFQENGKGNQEAVNAASWFSEILLRI